MKLRVSIKPQHALTLVEVLVATTAVALLVGILLPMIAKRYHRASKINCVNNLKQIGLSFRIWASDHQDKYPMRVSGTNGGTMEWVASGEVWQHFQVMSNELNISGILTCPNDRNRNWATNFLWLGNANISYFVGADADETEPQMFLSGDSNLEVDGKPVGPGLLNLWTNSALGWTGDRHVRQGNIALADGSVQQLSSAKLGGALRCTGVVTNRLAIP